MQTLENQLKLTFTLKSGATVSIYVDKMPTGFADKKAHPIFVLIGFDVTPIIVKKTLWVDLNEVASTEVVEVPSIKYNIAEMPSESDKIRL